MHRYGLTERFSEVSDVGFRFPDVLAGYSDPQPLIRQFIDSARRQIRNGADVLIAGEAPLCVLLAGNGLSSVDGVPVLDSLSSWIKHAETLVDLQRQSGITTCRKGYFFEPPSQQRIEEVLDFYGVRLPQTV